MLRAFFLPFMFPGNVSSLTCVSFHCLEIYPFFRYTELMQLTGVAAVLRFPMPELEDEPLDSDDDSD